MLAERKSRKSGLGNPFSGLSREQLEFLKKFPIYFFVPYIGMRFFNWSAVTSAIAAFESNALTAAGYVNQRVGSLILAGGNAFDLVIDCSGIVMIIMFLALYYAADVPQKKGRGKTRGPWIYLPVLFGFNLVRLLVTLAIGISFGGGVMQAAHFGLWFVDSGVVLACWAHAKRIEFKR